MVTMKEIANKAGVSVSTVSLVLNGRDEGRVKSKIADNVRAIATKLGYRSNPLASSLRTGRTHILGFISEEVATTPYAGGMILGAQTAASQFGYMLITVSTDGENSESEEIAALKRYGTDGFLYAKMSNRITHVPSSLAKTPLVLVDATDSLGKIPSVEPDEFQIATTPPPDWLRPDAHVSLCGLLGAADCAGRSFGRLSGGAQGRRPRL